MPDLGDINWLGVLAGVIALQILGFLWYGPLFGKQWMAAIGKTQEEMSGNVATAMTIGVVMSALSVIAMAIVLSLSETPDVSSGIKIGLLTGVGFTATTTIMNLTYEDRDLSLIWIYVGYQVIGYAIAGALLGALP